MLSKEELANEIKVIVENDDNDRLSALIKTISEGYSFECFDLMEDVLWDTNLDSRIRIEFCLKAMQYRKENNEGIRNIFTRQVIPYLLIESIKRGEEEFANAIKDKKENQEIVLDYFKENPGDAIDYWHLIVDLPGTKSKILDDEDFISEKMREEDTFFTRLPGGYEYLISYYNPEFNEYDFEYLQSLYQQYYGEVTDKDERTNLMALQYYLKANEGISPTILMQPLKFILKGIKRDRKMLNNIETISEKTKIKFIQTCLLVYKYKDSKLLKQLFECEEITDEMREKLEYLAKTSRILKINSMQDLENNSLEDIKEMEREVTYVSNAFGRGGPVSRTSIPIFPNSTYREVRRIDPNGEMHTFLVGNNEGHDEKVEEIYSEEVKFPETCKTAFSRSIEAAKQISAVTLVIESEQCHMYMPSDLTINQATKCIELVESSTEEGKFGAVVFDKEENRPYILSVDLVDKDEAKRCITRIQKRNIISSERIDVEGTDKEIE